LKAADSNQIRIVAEKVPLRELPKTPISPIFPVGKSLRHQS
jgi:hypothetical protein